MYILHVGLLCCHDGDVRLVGGSRSYKGRAEICFNETWGTICNTGWGTDDSTVTCRQLGYNHSERCMYLEI